MGGKAATHWEGCLEEWERILGRMKGTAATYWEGYFDSSGGIVATDREDSWEYRGCIYYNNRRACCCKKEGCCDIKGRLLRQMGRISGDNGDIFN